VDFGRADKPESQIGFNGLSKTGVVLGTEICEFCGAAMLAKLKAFLNDESGATAIEYGLIAAGISIVIIATVNGIGTKLNTKFASVSTQLK
jgi:pilus assembly protein Flp/PilA